MPDISTIDQKTVQLLTVLVVSIVAWLALQIFTKRLVNNISVGTPSGRRLRTLSSVIRSAVSILIVSFAIFECLSILGVDLGPLVAAAGISGLAIGFGAQSLIKDIISGFFLLAEDQLDYGDEIEIAGKRGVVEKFSLRTIWLRENNGNLHIVPNGSVVVVTNFTRLKGKKIVKKLDKKKV